MARTSTNRDRWLWIEQRPQVVPHFVPAVFLTVELGHVVAARLVTEHKVDFRRRHSVSLVQVYRLDRLRIRPTFEQPRVDDPGRPLDLQVGSTKRAFGSVRGHEDEVVVPPDAQVDRAHRHLVLKRSEPVAHMLWLRQYVEDEFDRSIELTRGENLEITRKL